MAFIDAFSDWLNYTATIVENQQSYDPSTGQFGPKQWVAVKSGISCGKYNASTTAQSIADNIRDVVSDVIIFDPADFEDFTFTDGMRIEIDGERYSLVQPDDVMGLGEVLQIYVKKDVA